MKPRRTSTGRYKQAPVLPRQDEDYLPDLGRTDVELLSARGLELNRNNVTDSDDRVLIPRFA